MSTDEVTVQAASINDLTSEAFLAYPTHALGTEYYIMSYQFDPATDPKVDGKGHFQGPSVFGLVGFYFDTVVEIKIKGQPSIEIILDQFMTYQVM